ncbi:hypothetical protein Xentx_00102 [Xenorhabdus thuongxuanensis]|uniref:Uncharacterized protein n=1 Tax=Xenorhabdus thuongxuanensis TaxID=1873484 RepID=A0A1Q5U978_9GAMM|nr:hypothetical protein Xentx_00102 [Xenorhabdus thuongxuanensis]
MPVSINKKKRELPFVVISPINNRDSGMIDLPSNRNLLNNRKSIFRPKQIKE